MSTAKCWSTIWEKFEHGSIQREILFYLGFRYPARLKRLIPEQRVQMAPGRFRISDICILAANAPYERVAATPPELCIEILSPADSVSRILERVDEYFAMGVPVPWECLCAG
jgi:Uma2 family endonuclease